MVVVVDTLDVDGGVGKGAEGSNRNMERLEKAVNGFGEQGLLVVPTLPPFHCSVWLVIVPSKSLAEEHPEGIVAVNVPSN